MELRASSQRAGISSSDCTSDPDEKEVSEGEGEDEDDDRNHKHRRRGDAHSQSLDGDSVDHGLTRPYRKRNRPFENGYSYREGDPQSWKNSNISSDRDFSRFEKRRPNQSSFSRATLELNQRIRGNHTMPGEVGLTRGRGREPMPWGLHDPRFGLVDVASQIVQPGPVPSALFAGRELSSVSNAQTPSWNSFGLVPGLPNGGLDALHPLGLQGPLRPVISPPINIGIPRHRCRDFEERGFCLRGDMCPMEHGINRIVIEDVQSLSQFNLPVSLPGSQLPGTSSGQGALPVIGTATGSLLNSKAFHVQNSNPGMTGFGSGFNTVVVGNSTAGASDVYDPDQPLWANDNPETSAALSGLNQSNIDETESFLEKNFSGRQNIESGEGFNDMRSLRNASAARSQSSSVWGRIGNSKPKLGVKESTNLVGTSSNFLEHGIKSGDTLNTGLLDVPHQGKWTSVDGNDPLLKESSLKAQGVSVPNVRKPSQKALRTLFVNGVPLKDNKRESILSHFQKFGEVIDIYIPMHSERAFVQFSKREEAEAALKAPDAVMGNRFIKLWWANRDNIPDDVKIGASSTPITPRATVSNPGLSHSFVLDQGKENPHPSSSKDSNAQASVPQQAVYDHTKATGSKASQPPQKKLESLELLKEELRKKQEMLDQKRNEFKRQLDKLSKQTGGPKDVTLSDPVTKTQNGDTTPTHAKTEAANTSPRDNGVINEKGSSAEHAVPPTTPSNQTVLVQDPLKPSVRPPPPGAPFIVNRFKLDNRPTTFRIVPPLPTGLANVATVKEHFSTYGDLSSVELEELELQSDDASVSSGISFLVSFTKRWFAEKAFLHGKTWQGHKLKFTWVPSPNSRKEGTSSGNLPASSNMPSDLNNQSSGEVAMSTEWDKDPAVDTGEPEEPQTKAEVDSAEHDKKDSNSTSTSSPSELQLF